MNIDELLSPISDAAPCGEDLSFSSEFDAIAELRREDDPTLDQGEWVTALKTADWPGVQAQCLELLSRRSKDLRLAMWLAEAATLNEGYTGLQRGLELCARLCERYWPALHPQADDGDMEQRVGNMSWFLKRMVTLSQAAAVTRGRGGIYSLQQMHAARSLQATIERTPEKAAQLSADAITLEKFNRALRETPKDALRQSVGALQACQTALAEWQAVVDGHLGNEGPSFVPAREALAAALHDVQRLARETGALQSEGGEAASLPIMRNNHNDTGANGGAARVQQAGNGASSPAGVAGGPPCTREQALAQLRDVAAFFRDTEPHSPVAYLADKAVYWAQMPLHMWLRSVIKDPGSLAHLEEMLGVQPPPSPENTNG